MTIRTRNRLSLILFFIALIVLIGDTGIFVYEVLDQSFRLPEVFMKGVPSSFILTYNPLCVVIALFINLLYVCTVTFVIYRTFEKTQANDITFFLLFLTACLLDNSRLIVPLFRVSGTFSRFLISVGNVNILARLLAPLALFGNTVLSTEDYRQNTDRNCLIIIVTALFFAYFIPLNTSVILPNFSISYGYVHLIRSFSLLISIINITTLFLVNKKNEYKQLMTFGFALLTVGYSIMFYCYNIIGIIAGPLFIGTGTAIYLKETHNKYLWID